MKPFIKTPHRNEIDGLRGISVLVVVFYHTGINLFKNGYLGVDVFFIISGYLITNIIICDYKNKQFSFLNFFERRARRLLPVLFFITIITIPFAWFFLSAELLENFGQSLVALNFFSSNILFFLTTWGYFDLSSELKPLIHTWSLAVEEQYYLLFPFLAIFFIKNFEKYFSYLLIILIILSFYIGYNENFFIFNIDEVEIETYQIPFAGKSWASFYLLPGRVWELMLGASASVYLIKNPDKSNNLLSIIGFILIISSFCFDLIPSDKYVLNSLPPALGTFLIIMFANFDSSIIKKILSNKILIFLGLISYSIYLWHQPIFSLVRIYNNNTILNLQQISILVTLIIILSYLSWKYIETPNRNMKLVTKIIFFKKIFLMFFIILFFGLFFHFSEGSYKLNKYKKMYPSIEFERDLSIKKYFSYLEEENKNNFDNLINNNKIKVFILGDSHAQDLFITLNQQEKLREKFIFSYSVNVDIININSKDYKISDIVIITYSTIFDKDFRYFYKINEKFKNDNKLFYVTTASPSFNVIGDDPLTAIIHKWHLTNKSKIKKIEIDQYAYDFINKEKLKKNDKLIATLDKMEIKYLNRLDYACPKINEKKCHAVTKDFKKIYFDENHITIEGAKYFGDLIYDIGWLDKILIE